MNILVLGIGQRLRGDDTSGLEAVQFWRQDDPQTASRVRIEENEFPGLDLLNLLDGMDAVVIVDAVHSKVPVGTLIVIGMEELASFKPDERSTHGWGVAETLQLGISINPGLAKCKITLIGIVV